MDHREKAMNRDIELTVGLPLWSADKIGWLAMEGLCYQRPPPCGWELLVCEEDHPRKLGAEFIGSYGHRLAAAGCLRLDYVPLPEWTPLPRKWRMMGDMSAKSSRAFLLQAADCYSFPERLVETHRRVVLEDYAWYDVGVGYFYSFISRQLSLFRNELPHRTHLNMAFTGRAARTIPDADLRKGVDGFLFKHCRALLPDGRRFLDMAEYAGVDTHGHNNISVSREKRMVHGLPDFFFPSTKLLSEIGLPPCIVERMMAMPQVPPPPVAPRTAKVKKPTPPQVQP
jgi:hypothetical protein